MIYRLKNIAHKQANDGLRLNDSKAMSLICAAALDDARTGEAAEPFSVLNFISLTKQSPGRKKCSPAGPFVNIGGVR